MPQGDDAFESTASLMGLRARYAHTGPPPVIPGGGDKPECGDFLRGVPRGSGGRRSLPSDACFRSRGNKARIPLACEGTFQNARSDIDASTKKARNTSGCQGQTEKDILHYWSINTFRGFSQDARASQHLWVSHSLRCLQMCTRGAACRFSHPGGGGSGPQVGLRGRDGVVF